MVAGLILAAGAGTRMGTPKALVELAGETLVARSVQVLADAGVEPIVVVVGAVDVTVADARVVNNPRWADGMGTSLAVGMSVLVDVGDVIVIPVDMPGLTAAAVRAFLQRAAGFDLARATFHGKPGHPVLIRQGHLESVIASLEPEMGAKEYLRAHRAVEIELSDQADGRDVDTPEQLARFIADAGSS
jgi:nicotine blue oxidoreductase